MDNAFEKGVKLMEALARSDGPKGVTELASELALAKSNVHRLLRSLVASGYASQDPGTERYEATIKFWELGFSVISRVHVRSFALPQMQELAAATREQVNLAVLDGGEIVYVAKIDSSQAVYAPIGVGNRSPVSRVALGKAMLAFQPEEHVQRVLGQIAPQTRSPSDTDAFLRELARVRSAGYAVNRGEWRDGVAGVAAPVFSAPGRCVAAVGISGPVERLRAKDTLQHAQHVLQAARTISAALGCPASEEQLGSTRRPRKP